MRLKATFMFLTRLKAKNSTNGYTSVISIGFLTNMSNKIIQKYHNVFQNFLKSANLHTSLTFQLQVCHHKRSKSILLDIELQIPNDTTIIKWEADVVIFEA